MPATAAGAEGAVDTDAADAATGSTVTPNTAAAAGRLASQPQARDSWLCVRRSSQRHQPHAEFGFANDEERTAKAVELLNETRKGLYGLLAADEEQSSQAE